MKIEINEKTGAVEINGILCAEVLTTTGTVVCTRDDLIRELGDKRALAVLRRRVTEAIRLLSAGRFTDHTYVNQELSTAAFGRGILDGLASKTVPHPQSGQPMLPDYSKGGQAGYELGALLVRVLECLKESPDGR